MGGQSDCNRRRAIARAASLWDISREKPSPARRRRRGGLADHRGLLRSRRLLAFDVPQAANVDITTSPIRAPRLWWMRCLGSQLAGRSTAANFDPGISRLPPLMLIRLFGGGFRREKWAELSSTYSRPAARLSASKLTNPRGTAKPRGDSMGACTIAATATCGTSRISSGPGNRR